MREKRLFFVLFLAISLTVSCQSDPQAQLLKKAYQSQSTELFYKFFDNWSEEVKTNEKEAQNSYVAEAHKVAGYGLQHFFADLSALHAP